MINDITFQPWNDLWVRVAVYQSDSRGELKTKLCSFSATEATARLGNSQPGAEGEGEEGEGEAEGREEKEKEKQEEEKTIGIEGGGVGQNFTATFRNKRLYF